MAEPKRLLFVCVENANRSQMAEGFARHHGGPEIEACSAGSRPSGTVNPRAITMMAERGIDLSEHASEGLERFDGSAVAVAVTMGCGDACPAVIAARREDWDLADPRDMDDEGFRAVRDEIERRVLELLASLRA